MFFQSDSKFILEDIEFVCNLTFEILKTPIYFLDNNNDIIFSLSYGFVNNPLHKDKKELFSNLFGDNYSTDYPIVKSTKYHENYFAVRLNKEDIFIGNFIVGPSTYSYINAETISSIISDYKIPLSFKKDLIT